MSRPEARHVWWKLPRQFRKLPKKFIFNGFWHRDKRIYIYVAHGQVLTNKYIYMAWNHFNHKAWIKFSVNRIFDMNVYFSSIASFRSDVQQTKSHYENQWCLVHFGVHEIASHQGVWWKYQLIGCWFQHVKWQYPLWWHGLSRSGAKCLWVWF
jgi:hypothetical protein